MGTLNFKYKIVRKESFSNLFSYLVLLLSVFLVIGCGGSSDSGVKQWTKQLGTSSGEGGSDLEVYSSNNQDYIFITGTTDGELDGNTNTSSGSDTFIVKYNTNYVKQ